MVIVVEWGERLVVGLSYVLDYGKCIANYLEVISKSCMLMIAWVRCATTNGSLTKLIVNYPSLLLKPL